MSEKMAMALRQTADEISTEIMNRTANLRARLSRIDVFLHSDVTQAGHQASADARPSGLLTDLYESVRTLEDLDALLASIESKLGVPPLVPTEPHQGVQAFHSASADLRAIR